MSLRCRFGWHDWSRWTSTKVAYHSFGKVVGHGSGQCRSCRRCGIEAIR